MTTDEFGHIALGVELGHGGVGEVAAIGGGAFVVHVGQYGSDELRHSGAVMDGEQRLGIRSHLQPSDFSADVGTHPALRVRTPERARGWAAARR